MVGFALLDGHTNVPWDRVMPQTVPERSGFPSFVATTRELVDRALPVWLSPRVEATRALGPDVAAVAEAVRDLVIRGGKRLRAALLAAAYAATGGGAAEGITPALVAIELLQAYLLAHDDWMDEDEVRRGGPSVHAVLRERFGSAKAGGVGAVLAGDLAAGWALEALCETPVAGDRVAAAARVLARVESAVVLGQTMDVRGSGDRNVMYDLKTGSYTVRGPLAIGAALAGAPPAVVGALERFAAPLGVAFQLRDDLLSTFGDARATGKPTGGDLRQGKRTSLIERFAERAGADDRALLARVLGVAEAPASDVERLIGRLASSGARDDVEVRVASLLEEARTALGRVELSPSGRTLLEGAVSSLGERTA